MSDKYANFRALASSEQEGKDFSVKFRDSGSIVAVVAPHGGAIEPGTSEIAVAIAAENLSFYVFEGLKPKRNSDLHITSSNFDEPRCMTLIKSCARVLTIHGEESNHETVFLGGRDDMMGKLIRQSLEAHDFRVCTHAKPELQGRHLSNICNLGQSKAGVQLELSRGLRQSFFASLDRAGRAKPTARLTQFVTAIRDALL